MKLFWSLSLSERLSRLRKPASQTLRAPTGLWRASKKSGPRSKSNCGSPGFSFNPSRNSCFALVYLVHAAQPIGRHGIDFHPFWVQFG